MRSFLHYGTLFMQNRAGGSGWSLTGPVEIDDADARHGGRQPPFLPRSSWAVVQQHEVVCVMYFRRGHFQG